MALYPSPESNGTLAETVLVLTRFALDADAVARILRQARLSAQICSDVEMFCAQVPHCLIAIATMEALPMAQRERLAEALAAQAPWSDVPLVLLVGRAVHPTLHETWSDLGNVTVLERPLRQAALLAVVDSAVRARRRQWQVRDLLTQSEQMTRQLTRAMTETHHRVKNNLQLIAALVDLSTIEETEVVPRTDMVRLGTNIKVLASIHDILTNDARKGGGDALPVHDVLERLLTLMQESVDGRRIRSQIEEMRLPTQQCTSLVLVLNELVTNALKHSAGDVIVRLTVQGAEALLTVQDGGKGFPPDFDPLVFAHIGLELVTNLSRHDLHGRLEFENASDGGGCVRLTFPLPILPA